MATEPRTVAIFGGSFNPPHVAHVLVATYILQVADVDEVWIEPVFRHPLDKPLTASFEDRVAMCELAFRDLGQRVVVRQDEFGNPTGRTFELLETLAVQHPTVQFRLVVGSDLLQRTSRWHNLAGIRAIAPLLVVQRPGSLPTSGGPDEVLPVEMPHLSSHALRTELALSHSIAGKLPQRVWQHILAHGLYSPPAGRA